MDLADAVKRARAVLKGWLPQVVEKTIWGSPAGKKRLAKRLVALLPPHRTYVEPFAGSAAVLFAKEPAPHEVIGDADPEIAEAYRTLQAMTPHKLARLGAMTWKGDEATFKRLLDAKPKGELERLHKFLYLSHFSYGKLRGKSFNHNASGIEANTIKRIEQHAPRLKKVRVHGGDYQELVRKYDGKDTLFYFDPPYAGYNVQVGEDAFDEEQFYEHLKTLKGQFLLTYGIRGKLPLLLKGSTFDVRRIRTPRGIRSMRGVGGPSVLTQLVVANYPLVRKCAWLEPWDGQLELDDAMVPERKAVWSTAYVNGLPDSAFLYVEPGGHKDDEGKTVPRSLRHFPVRNDEGELDPAHLRNAIARIPQSKVPGLSEAKLRELQDQARRLLADLERGRSTGKGIGAFERTIPLLKGADPSDERYVLGIVLEPDVVDAQQDTYSAAEVRQAAHKFMEDFGNLGLQHQRRVNDEVKILETYLAPVDFAVGEATIKKGTWLLAVRVLSDALWDRVKQGELTGFSIGGSARRQPEPDPPKDAQTA